MYLNKDVIWASIWGGGSLLKSTDGGNTWQNVVLPISIYAEDVFFINDNTGWVCGENGNGPPSYVLGTTDGGKNWNVLESDSNSNSFFTIEAKQN